MFKMVDSRRKPHTPLLWHSAHWADEQTQFFTFPLDTKASCWYLLMWELSMAASYPHMPSQEFFREILKPQDGQIALCILKDQKTWWRNSLLEVKLHNWLRDIHMCPILWPAVCWTSHWTGGALANRAWAQAVPFSRAQLSLRRPHCAGHSVHPKLHVWSATLRSSPVSRYMSLFIITTLSKRVYKEWIKFL